MGANLTFGENDDIQLKGASTGTLIGNVGDSLKVTASTAVSTYLDNNQVYSTALDVSAATSGTDNPLILFRNPLGSGKSVYILGVILGSTVANVAIEFKLLATPVFNTTVANISNITQTGLSTTVTVTTATNHNATVGATATIAGTVNFNGAWTVASVTSATVYTFTKTAPLITTTETTGTSSVPSSLGTLQSAYPRYIGNSAPSSISLVNTLPTVSSNGNALSAVNVGQNTTSLSLDVDFKLALKPDNAFLLTGNPGSNNRNAAVTLIWAEV